MALLPLSESDDGMRCDEAIPDMGLVFVYYIDAWFLQRLFSNKKDGGTSNTYIEPWRCSIGWTLHGTTDDADNTTWKTMDHLSTLPHAAIPKDGIDFFAQFLTYLSGQWYALCENAQRDLLLLVSAENLLNLDLRLTVLLAENRTEQERGG